MSPPSPFPSLFLSLNRCVPNLYKYSGGIEGASSAVLRLDKKLREGLDRGGFCGGKQATKNWDAGGEPTTSLSLSLSGRGFLPCRSSPKLGGGVGTLEALLWLPKASLVWFLADKTLPTGFSL